MSHSITEVAVIVARVAAGVAGAVAFYLAFFLYEGEEGVWQNRVDGFWVAVDDRARLTHSKTLAILNNLARLVQTTLNRPFGEKLISLRAVMGSITVSVSTAAAAFFVAKSVIVPHEEISALLFSWIFVVCAVCPFFFSGTLSRTLCFLPSVVVLIQLSRDALILYIDALAVRPPQLYMTGGWFLALSLSILTDICVVYAIRRKFSQIAVLNSTSRMVVAIAYLINVCLAASGIPYCVYVLMPNHPNDFLILTPRVAFNLFIEALSSSLFLMNLCSFVYALIPCGVLCFLVLHRMFWPSFARAVYAIRRYQIFKNKKLLLVICVLCFALAFNLHKETADVVKDIFKGFLD